VDISRSDRQRSLFGVIAAMAVVNLVYGITFPLFALVLDAQGVSKTLIGLNTMVQALAVVVLAPVAPRLMGRFQPAKIMQGSVFVLAALFILAGWFPNVWFWFPLRFLIGAATALLWIASEAMVNTLAQENWRGRIIGIYSSVGAAGFALAPVLLIVTGSAGMLPFVSTSVLTLLAALPLFWSAEQDLSRNPSGRTGLGKVILLAPAVMLANIVYAAAVESISTFFPLYGLHLGLAGEVALGMMTIMGLGGMVLELPLSWLADHVNRMGMLLLCVVLTLAGLLAMPQLVIIPWVSVVFVFLFGGISGMIYTLGVILIGEQFKGAMLATATTAFTACWGTGSVIGPLIVGAGMDWIGVQHMALIIFMIFLPYLPFPIVAWVRSRARV
jgi:MFS family permease